MQLGGGTSGAPAGPEAGASIFEEVVDAFEFAGEEFIVMAEFEQLRIGVFEKLDGGLGAGDRVVKKGSVPADHGQVGRIVRDAALQHFLALALRRPLVLDVSWGGVFEAGAGGTGAEDLAQLVQANFLRHIELDQDEDRTLQRGFYPAGWDGLELNGVCGDSCDDGFTFHDIHSAPQGLTQGSKTRAPLHGWRPRGW